MKIEKDIEKDFPSPNRVQEIKVINLKSVGGHGDYMWVNDQDHICQLPVNHYEPELTLNDES